MIEQLQSIESAAKTLSLSPWTLRAYIRQGRIRPVRIGRRVLLSSGELQRLIEEGKSSAGCCQAIAEGVGQ
jgi:excisionase family DNA binding protein